MFKHNKKLLTHVNLKIIKTYIIFLVFFSFGLFSAFKESKFFILDFYLQYNKPKIVLYFDNVQFDLHIVT